MSTVELFRFDDTVQIRTVDIDGRRWAVAADICAALDISNPSMALSRLDDADKLVIRRSDTLTSTEGIWEAFAPQVQAIGLVSEDGATDLVLDSRKPEARRFRRFLTHVVWPSIRDTGSYGAAPVERLTPLEYARRLVAAEERAEAGEKFQRAIEAGDGITLTEFHKKYFSAVRESDFFTHLYTRKWLINQRGKGSVRTNGPRAGTCRDGSEHRHPTFKGKPYMYLHSSKDSADRRRENTRVRPGEYELRLRDRLIEEGLVANESTADLFELESSR